MVAVAPAPGKEKRGQSICRRTSLPEWDVYIVDPTDVDDPHGTLVVRVPASTRPKRPTSDPCPVAFENLRFVRARRQPRYSEGDVGWFYANAVTFSSEASTVARPR
jgi:hypothetical protein